MTTDITELAQREKFEAWFKSSFHPDKTGPYIKDQLYFAWKAAGAELVEALEAAQQDQQKFSFSMTQNEMEKYAEMYRSDNNDSSSAFLPASEITWIEGFLSPHAFSSVFTHESATNWLNSEVKIHKGDQIADTYIDLQKNPAVNPVVVVFQKGKPMIWDGYHRIAAAIIRGQPIYAIFSISLLEPLVLATELESRTVKLPDGWQFEECEIEGCENGAIFSVGTGSRNIHLCDKCAHEPQNSRLKKSPLSKLLPFKMSAGIKVEAE